MRANVQISLVRMTDLTGDIFIIIRAVKLMH